MLFFCMVALLAASCSTVPLTGRRQMLLVSDSELLTASLTQYDQYMKTAKKSTDKDKTATVVRVGKKIAEATETYLKQNGLENELKHFRWEFNLINDNKVKTVNSPVTTSNIRP